MFKKLSEKIFLKLNPEKTTIHKDDLSDLEKAKEDYVNLYKQIAYKNITQKEKSIKKWVVAEFIPREYKELGLLNDESFINDLKTSLAKKFTEIIKNNMQFKQINEDSYGLRFEAVLNLIESEEA